MIIAKVLSGFHVILMIIILIVALDFGIAAGTVISKQPENLFRDSLREYKRPETDLANERVIFSIDFQIQQLGLLPKGANLTVKIDVDGQRVGQLPAYFQIGPVIFGRENNSPYEAIYNLSPQQVTQLFQGNSLSYNLSIIIEPIYLGILFPISERTVILYDTLPDITRN